MDRGDPLISGLGTPGSEEADHSAATKESSAEQTRSCGEWSVEGTTKGETTKSDTATEPDRAVGAVSSTC